MIKKILTGLVALCALYVFATAAYSLYIWSRMSERAWGTVQSWHVIELNASSFAIEADFTFTYREHLRSGITRFSKPYHFNRPSAEKEIERKQAERAIVFFDPAHSSRASLERAFPLKKSLYSLMTIGICAYFLLLNSVFFKQSMQKA